MIGHDTPAWRVVM